jgi:hypothetical protein
MRFSDRIGVTQPKAVLQTDVIDEDLKNGLWEACTEFYLHPFGTRPSVGHTIGVILKDVYVNYFKQTSDNIEFLIEGELQKQKDTFFELDWFEVYNFLEFLSGSAVRNFKPQTNAQISDPKKFDERFRSRVNFFLEREKSAYRFVGDAIVPITSELERSAIEQAMAASDRFSGARSHIQHAIALYGRKPEPDYRNAIKEAISAVESVVRVITKNEKSTLGDALKALESIRPLHPAFKQAMEKLYGYTSDEAGIRHSLIDLTKVDEADAKFMIVTCSAFVNFCVQRS